MTDLVRGAWVGYTIHDSGYDVRVYDDESNIVHEYNAGNSRFDSAAYVPRGDAARLPVSTLRKYAKQTAQEIAAEYGVNLAMIQEEENDE